MLVAGILPESQRSPLSAARSSALEATSTCQAPKPTSRRLEWICQLKNGLAGPPSGLVAPAARSSTGGIRGAVSGGRLLRRGGRREIEKSRAGNGAWRGRVGGLGGVCWGGVKEKFRYNNIAKTWSDGNADGAFGRVISFNHGSFTAVSGSDHSDEAR